MDGTIALQATFIRRRRDGSIEAPYRQRSQPRIRSETRRNIQMKLTNLTKTAGAGAGLALVAIMGMLMSAPRGRAQGGNAIGADEVARIQQGLAIAPVRLNLTGKSPQQINLVGLGSYLVNAANDCNFCHNSGGPPNFNFLAGHNPYFLNQGPKITDPGAYLAGGTPFGTALPFNDSSSPYGSYLGPLIISRNLTPDLHGVPEGGHTLPQFMDILRTGHDLDNIHPTCTTALPTPSPANCIPPPVDGSRLQVMPWPDFQDMTDNDIAAIYEYLSAIPCNPGPAKVTDLP